MEEHEPPPESLTLTRRRRENAVGSRVAKHVNFTCFSVPSKNVASKRLNVTCASQASPLVGAALGDVRDKPQKTSTGFRKPRAPLTTQNLAPWRLMADQVPHPIPVDKRAPKSLGLSSLVTRLPAQSSVPRVPLLPAGPFRGHTSTSPTTVS